MRRKRFGQVLLLAFTILLGSNTLTATAESTGNSEPVTLTFVYPGITAPDQELVEEAMNRILVKKIGAKLKLVPIDWGSYDQKQKVLLAAGEPVDLMFTATWMGNHESFLEYGIFAPLSDLLAQHAPGMKKSLPPVYLQGGSVNGELFALPVRSDHATWKGLLLNKQLVDKYKFDVGKIKTLADLEPMLRTIKQKEKAILPVFAKGNDFLSFAVQEEIGGTPGALVPGKGNEIINEYETAEMKNVLTLQYNWYKKGYINHDKQSNASYFLSYPKADQKATFAVVSGEMTFQTASQVKQASGTSWVEVKLSEPSILSSDITGAMTAIPLTSEHPEKAMQLLNLLYTDKELINLLNYGIEGQHYKRVKGSSVAITPIGSDYTPYLSWMIGNPSIALHYPEDTPDAWSQGQRIFRNAKPSPLLGFYYRPSDPDADLQMRYLKDEFQLSLLMKPPSDPAKSLPKLLKQLQEAGIDDYIADKQKQFDEFLASHK